VVSSRRKKVAVFLDYMAQYVGAYETQLRDSLDAKCRELDFDLTLVYGGTLEEPTSWSAAQNAIFDLLRPEYADGLILVSTCLASAAGPDPVCRLADRFRTMPRCSIGLELPGHPSVTIDNRVGMEAVLEHLIGDHGRRRLAFIGGAPNNPEARIRLAVYEETLARHGIPPDPSLIATGHFVTAGGSAAMQELIARGVAMDAVVAANDVMAFGAMSALRQHGYRVPLDLPVTGFDDIPQARLGNPPLTSVAQPFEAMAALALELVRKQISGQSVAENNRLPADLVVRRSCGCGIKARRPIAPSSAVREPAAFVGEHAESLLQMLAGFLRAGGHPGKDGTPLLAALQRELAGKTGSFLRRVEELIDESGADLECCRTLEDCVLGLREELRPVATPELEDLWHDARAVIGRAIARFEFMRQVELDRNYIRMQSVSGQLSLSLDLPSLTQALGQALPAVGVKTAFCSRHVPDSAGELESFVCLLDGQPLAPSATRFQDWQLLPPGSYPAATRATSLVFPLYFESHRLGVVVFEYTNRMQGFQLLRDQIAAALHSVGLYQEVREKTLLHERSVQERVATAQRLASLSLLAGGVAHDLNNSLGPLVALPDVILAELGELPAGSEMVADLCLDVESIKSAALRAAQTIKDLLTLGRQGRTTKEPLDLNVLVQACLAQESLRSLPDARVAIKAELAPTPLVVHASEAHLMRAIVNLVRNAVEAIGGPGQVVVKTFGTVLFGATSGYETVDPGDYAVVTVSDTGGGIAKGDLGRVFEPFFTKKRVGDTSGSGLGLAIVHGVVKEHEGFVDVASSLGSGTTFTLYFPRAEEPTTAPGVRPELSRGRARILMVDDEPIQLRTGRRVLTHLGYQVDVLDSGRKVLERLAEAAKAGQIPYDLLILDLVLNEEQDGLDLYAQIQRLFPGQKAIVVSGHAPTERAELAIAQGLAWLAKPYSRDALVSAVQAALTSRPSLTVVSIPPPRRPPLNA
jgi:DNA-binding LacI/PurR family transcriptional regulator/signal transduction histidine kinase/ActR/RegA family two-component response regulator